MRMSLLIVVSVVYAVAYYDRRLFFQSLGAQFRLDETTIELTKEGHWKVHTGQKIQEGTYEVDGDKIVFTIPLGGGKFLSFSHTIERLTDTELHVKNELGELREFKKQ